MGLLFLMVSCRGAPPVAPVPAACTPMPLTAVQDLGPDFTWEHRLRATFPSPSHGTRTETMRVVVQKRDNVLRVVGLAPAGPPLFAVEQRGLEVTVVRAPLGGLPFTPETILADIHRAHFPLVENGQKVTEEIQAGMLVGRTITGPYCPAGEVQVDYDPGVAPGDRATHVVLVHHGAGYRLVVDAL